MPSASAPAPRRLRLAPGGFVLESGLPQAWLDELGERDLPHPEWTPDLRAWRYGDEEMDAEALMHLVTAHRVEADRVVRAELEDLWSRHGTAGPDARLARLEQELRPYQIEGVEFLLAKKRAILADSMGLGKSLQALVAIERAAAYPCIIVCPAAVKLGWRREALRWTPWRTVQVLMAGKDALEGSDITVVNPELLPRLMDGLQALGAKALVLDEAHFFKNANSQRSRNALDLAKNVPLRFALTGTPIKNRREDLVHQLRILDQLEPVLSIYRGLLPHWYKPSMGPLAEHHAVNVLAQLDRKTLNARLREVCMVRRTKQEVAHDLPALGRTRVDVTMAHVQEYRQEEKAMLDWMRKWHERFGAQAVAMEKGAGFERGAVFEFRAHLSRLRRQAALGKIAAVKDWVEPLIESGERVIFFAHHRDVVARLAEALPGKVATITGETPPITRRALLDNLDNFDFLVATMDSTGYGVDGIQLHASQVAFIELDWTPTKHEQCEGRLHRIGQTDPVNSWYFVAANTIDGAMMGILERKWADIQGVVEGRDEEAFLGDLLATMAAQKPWEKRDGLSAT